MYELILIIVFIIISEFFLRFLKNKTKDKDFENIKRVPSIKISRSYQVSSLSNDLQNSQKSELLGWDLLKDNEIDVKINIPYFKDSYTCKYSLNNLGARSNLKEFNSKKKFFGTFGCSISYGYALNEKQTFSHLINQELNDYNYLNFSVPGYSLHQSLLKYKLKSKDLKFDFIIVGIHPDLEKRNTCSIKWINIIDNLWKIPRIYKIGKIFNFLPSGQSKFEIINILKFFIGSIKFIQKSTMEHLLLEFKKECLKNNTKLYILCVDNYSSMYDFLIKNKFNWNSASIDLDQKNSKNEHVWQLMPWDNHPNKEANIIYSKKVLELINFKNNNGENFKPDTSGDNKQKNPQEYIYPLW